MPAARAWVKPAAKTVRRPTPRKVGAGRKRPQRRRRQRSRLGAVLPRRMEQSSRARKHTSKTADHRVRRRSRPCGARRPKRTFPTTDGNPASVPRRRVRRCHPATPAPAAPPPPAAETEGAPVAPETVAEEPIIGPSDSGNPARRPTPPQPPPAEPWPDRRFAVRLSLSRDAAMGGRSTVRRADKDSTAARQGYGRQDRFERRDEPSRTGPGRPAVQRIARGRADSSTVTSRTRAGGTVRRRVDGDRSQDQGGMPTAVSAAWSNRSSPRGSWRCQGRDFGFLREPKRNFVQTPARRVRHAGSLPQVRPARRPVDQG